MMEGRSHVRRCKNVRESRDPVWGYWYPFLVIQRPTNLNPTSRFMRGVDDRGLSAALPRWNFGQIVGKVNIALPLIL